MTIFAIVKATVVSFVRLNNAIMFRVLKNTAMTYSVRMNTALLSSLWTMNKTMTSSLGDNMR